jgi:iron complex outermembrane receptor protein
VIKRKNLISWNLTVLAASALTAASATAQNVAQDASDDADGGLAEIMVTAERFSSSVQKSPVAITAVDAQALEERMVTNVLTAAQEIPGIKITAAQGSNTSASIALRGVGQSTAGINFDPAVGIYIDGVYQPRINGAFFDFFDIASMEVLRGPQGTLYGRNSSGGALKIQTKRPNYLWEGKAELSAGNFDYFGGKAYLTGPLIDDVLAFSVSGVARQRDGFLYGTEHGRQIGDIDSRAERVKLLFTPNEKFEAELSVFAIQDYSEAGVPVPLQVFPGINIPEANGSFNRDLTRTEIYGPLGEGSINNLGVALNMRYFVSDTVEFNSITGYGNQRTSSTGNTLFVSAAMQDAKERGEDVTQASNNQGRTHNEFWTQELNMTYNSERLKGVVGLYYMDEEGQSRATTANSPTIDQDRLTTASAVFAQGTYYVGGGVGLTAGVRYTREEAEFTQFYRQLLGASQSANKTFTSTTPKFGVNWEVSQNFMTYASYTQGFKSGGFNPIPPNANTGVPDQIGSPTPYNPEDVESYEVGFKYQTLDSKFRLNAALFRAKYDGMQLPVFFPGTSTIYTSNATSGVVKGVELEPTWQINRDLMLYGNLSYNEGEYTGPFPCSNQFGQRIDCQDKELVGLIPWKGMLGVRYSPALPVPGSVTLNGSWSYHDEYQNNVANTPLVYTVDASTYNASVSWLSPDEKWNMALDVRNLTDKHYSLAGLQQSHPVQPAVSAFPNSPREIVFRVGVNF